VTSPTFVAKTIKMYNRPLASTYYRQERRRQRLLAEGSAHAVCLSRLLGGSQTHTRGQVCGPAPQNPPPTFRSSLVPRASDSELIEVLKYSQAEVDQFRKSESTIVLFKKIMGSLTVCWAAAAVCTGGRGAGGGGGMQGRKFAIGGDWPPAPSDAPLP
jgi:hypothetical protein